VRKAGHAEQRLGGQASARQHQAAKAKAGSCDERAAVDAKCHVVQSPKASAHLATIHAGRSTS
jgi:hypothetical protein